MRWLWIDTIVKYEPGKRLVAVKNVSLAEEHLHDHFACDAQGPAQPLVPASLLLEGLAQTSGILVGSVQEFREKVILAKVTRFTLDADVGPGHCVRFDATIERLDVAGASTQGTIERLSHADGEWRAIGSGSLMFSHIDRNFAGREFPKENFVFGENFRTILSGSGLQRFLMMPGSVGGP